MGVPPLLVNINELAFATEGFGNAMKRWLAAFFFMKEATDHLGDPIGPRWDRQIVYRSGNHIARFANGSDRLAQRRGKRSGVFRGCVV